MMIPTLKIFLKVIPYRISTKYKSGSSLLGYRKNLGTREALAGTLLLVLNCYEHRKDVIMCFIDFKKFD